MTEDNEQRMEVSKEFRTIAQVLLLITAGMAAAGCIVVETPDVSATVEAELTRLAESTPPDVPATVAYELTRLAPTATSVPLPTAAATPVPTYTPRATPTATPRSTPILTPRPTATATPRPRPTATPWPTATRRPTPIPTPTATPRPTRTPIPTATPWPRIEYCVRNLEKFARTETYRDEQGFRQERDVFRILEEFRCTYDNGRTRTYVSPIWYDQKRRQIYTLIQYDGVKWSTICETKLKCESKMGPGLWQQYWNSLGKRFDPADDPNWSWRDYYDADRTDWLRKVN